MAVTISITGPRQTVRAALAATATNCTEIIIPARYRRVGILLRQNDDATNDTGKFAYAGTDGAAIGNNYQALPTGRTVLEVSRTKAADSSESATWSIFVTAATNTAFAHLDLYQD